MGIINFGEMALVTVTLAQAAARIFAMPDKADKRLINSPLYGTPSTLF
jgi:hypothetical protein